MIKKITAYEIAVQDRSTLHYYIGLICPLEAAIEI